METSSLATVYFVISLPPAVRLKPLPNSTRHSAKIYHAVPWFLPDGRHFLYQVGSTKPENRAVFIGSLDSKSRKRLMTLESKAIYSPPGFILFLQGQTLM